MNREIIKQAYNGYLNNDVIESRIEEYFNVLENNKLNKDLVNTHLIIASDDKEQALDFATYTAKLLCDQKICHSYKLYNLNTSNISNISKALDNIVIVNNYDEYIDWKDIKQAISSIDQIVILCTTRSNLNRYKEDTQSFYDLFVKQIYLQSYSIDDICSAAKIYIEELKSTGKILSYDDSFFSALDKYIRTVYPRSILQGREFVENLEERIIRKSYETKKPLELTEKTIPVYFKQESTDEIEKNIKDYFCFSSEMPSILKKVSDCANLKNSRGFTEYAQTVHLNVTGYSFEYVEKFANIYARLLNSDRYNLIHAKDVTIMNLYDVMREKDNFKDKHGLILLKDFDLVKTFLNANEVIDQLIQIIEDKSNDLVWMLFGHHEFKEMMNSDNEQKLYGIFDKEYSLDAHDKNSSEKYIRYCYENKQFANVPLKLPKKLDAELCNQVLNAGNQKEATYIIEKYIVEHIKETNDFDEVQAKEEQIHELVQNVKDDETDQKEVNILLLAMSTLNNISVSTYTYDDGEYSIQGKYISSLEPIPKALAESLAHKNNKLDEIYVLNTKSTLRDLNDKMQYGIKQYADTDENYSVYTYFKERCSCLIDTDKIHSISLERDKRDGTSETDVEKALYELSQYLNAYLLDGKKVNLYVDIHGGLRSIQTIVDAIIMLIKDIDNIELKDILTGVFSNDAFTIVSTKKDFEIFNFVSGVREFLSFGRSNGLVEFNHSREEKVESKKLVDGINAISDSIVLNRMEKFADNLNELSGIVNTQDKEKGYYDTIKNLIKANYRVVINEENLDLLGEDITNFPAQLQWCLDKNLLQQALMLIENRTSNALENANILNVKTIVLNNKKERKLDLLGDWAKYSLALDQWKKKDIGVKEDVLKTKPPVNNLDNLICYKEMKNTELFNNIKIMVVPNVKAAIKSRKNNTKEYPTQYLNVSDNFAENTGKEYYVKFYNKNVSQRAAVETIPIKDKLIGNQAFLESLYTLLYVYKNLKWYRNTVAHPSEIKEEEDLKVEELRAWIEFYIEIFTEVLKEANDIMGKPNTTKTEEKEISLDDALANLTNRFGSKYKK